MNEWENAKKDYASVEIPAELTDRVQAGMKEGRRRASHRRVWLRSAGSLAACFAVLLMGLNLSPAFAAAAADLPVVGGLCQVLTVRSWESVGDGVVVHVDQPAVSAEGAFAQQINQEIQARVDQKIAEGNQLVEDYKEAFLATGGTVEEWAQRGDSQVSVTYDIKSQTDTTVSFVINYFVSIASAYQEQYFYNLDLNSGRELTLEELLGSDWVSICNASISGQIAQQDPNWETYFAPETGGFTTVDETTSFYLDAAGDVVVVFPEYAIAPGSMGIVEFKIAK